MSFSSWEKKIASQLGFQSRKQEKHVEKEKKKLPLNGTTTPDSFSRSDGREREQTTQTLAGADDSRRRGRHGSSGNHTDMPYTSAPFRVSDLRGPISTLPLDAVTTCGESQAIRQSIASHLLKQPVWCWCRTSCAKISSHVVMTSAIEHKLICYLSARATLAATAMYNEVVNRRYDCVRHALSRRPRGFR